MTTLSGGGVPSSIITRPLIKIGCGIDWGVWVLGWVVFGGVVTEGVRPGLPIPVLPAPPPGAVGVPPPPAPGEVGWPAPGACPKTACANRIADAAKIRLIRTYL